MTDFQQSLRGTVNDPLFRAAGDVRRVCKAMIDALGVLWRAVSALAIILTAGSALPVASTVRSWGPFVNVACAPAALIEQPCAAPQLHPWLASGGVRI